MATEVFNYPAFPSYPATGPVTGPPRHVVEGRVVRVLLTGVNMLARVQISNATPGTATPSSLFLPPEESWTDFQTVTESQSGPIDIPSPTRWVRVRLVSGTCLTGTIEADTRQALRVTNGQLLSVIQDATQVIRGLTGEAAEVDTNLNGEVVTVTGLEIGRGGQITVTSAALIDETNDQPTLVTGYAFGGITQ